MKNFIKFLCSGWGAFLLGGIIGALFFGAMFGFAVVNPLATDWIWHGVTHDTAQHYIGWEFFRADSTGGVINGLCYPVGLPVTFMDAIPLLAFLFKFLGVGAGLQYFGLWAIICYVLMGGIGAVLARKIWLRVVGEPSRSQQSGWASLFAMAGALILVLSPMMIARTLYHPALAAHWLILLGILLIWNAPKFAKWWQFTLVWSGMLVGAVLIHPYFLPMLGAMMLIAALRTSAGVLKLILQIAIPGVLAILVFWAIGGFALGSGAEIRDLHEKGFNLLSFANPYDYSAILPAYPNASSSPETMMWLGLGVWAMLVAAAVMWCGRYKKSFRELKRKFAAHRARNIAMAVVAFGLLAFAIGVRVDVGPLAVFQWQPPDKIYELWSAFRAAAREGWPFYYATILLIIYWFSLGVKNVLSKNPKSLCGKNVFACVATSLALISVIQFADIWFSKNATMRREGFTTARTTAPEFPPPEIDDLVTTQKHLVMLDSGFRGDQSGTYEISRAALANKLTLNVGFFARIPDEIWTQQTAWRDKITHGELIADDLRDYIFATTDEKLATEIARNYDVVERGEYYFITAK